MTKKVAEHQKKVKEFRSNYGNKVIDEVTVNQVYGGMRGLKVLVTETSHVDPNEGVNFRGYTVPQIRKLLPQAEGGEEPLPEAMFWLLLTGEIPTTEQVKGLSKMLAHNSELPPHVITMLNNFPSNLRPISQFSAAVTACNTESAFAKAYAFGANRATILGNYWEFVFEDTLKLLGKLPVIAAIIYRNLYRDGSAIGKIKMNDDWSKNFTSMLGYSDPMFTEFMRLNLTLYRFLIYI